MEQVLFLVLAVIALATALNVIVQRNPLYSALSLIGTLASLSALYLTLHAQFIAAIQIVVYAGAIMVLFIFVIMLLNVPKNQPVIEKHRFLGFLAIPFAGVMILETFSVLKGVPRKLPPVVIESGDKAVGATWSIGFNLFTQYLLPFEVTSVLILMAVVGAMVLARREGD